MKRLFGYFLSINPVSITTGLIVIVLILFLMGIPILDSIELKTYDIRFRARGVNKPTSSVALAVIDEKSLDAIGKWPWPRAKMAKLVDLLSDNGAKVICFDIGFWEPDTNTNHELLGQIEREIEALGIKEERLTNFIKKRKAQIDNDLILARSISNSKAKVVLGHFFHMNQSALGFELTPEEIDYRRELIEKSQYPLIRFEEPGLDIGSYLTDFTAYAPECNLKMLTDAAESCGYFNTEADPDGIIRSLFLIVKSGPDFYAPLSIQSVREYLDEPQTVIKMAVFGIEGIQLGDIFIPTDERGRMFINWVGPEKTFPRYSIIDIFNNKFPKEAFRDKIVLVGNTAIGLGDMRNTPFSSSGEYPGLEVQATVMDNILSGNFLHKPIWSHIYDILAIIVLGIFTGAALPRLGAVRGILFAIVLFVLNILVSRMFFNQFGLLINIVYPLLTIVLVYTCLTLFRYFTEERERRKIKGAFSHYVSSSVVNEMLKNPERLKLGGDKKDLSVLFSDIRGFTTISEGLTPEELVHLLNEYLTVMTDIVFKYEGTLDKYMGDAIMAVYGAPLEQADHPARACHSAIDMMEGLKELNEKWIHEGRIPLDIGIGINTGSMMVGNMGSVQRFDYTVMGDAVNLGSRLEGANKSYRTNILISESTYERVKDRFVCMELDSVRVKGKTLPVSIYQLIGEYGRVSKGWLDVITTFHKGLQSYREQDWDSAITAFRTVAGMDPSPYSAELYIQRAMELKNDPPGADWDGVFTMKAK